MGPMSALSAKDFEELAWDCMKICQSCSRRSRRTLSGEQIVTAVRRIGWVLGMILCLLVGLTGGAVMGWAAGEILAWSARL
jgi:hypothetical protein